MTLEKIPAPRAQKRPQHPCLGGVFALLEVADPEATGGGEREALK